MMPTRLQDGLSVSLLQWMRTVDSGQKKSVVIRINDMESVSDVIHNLENAGLADIEQLSGSTVRGTVTSEALSCVVRCPGVCYVTSDERE